MRTITFLLSLLFAVNVAASEADKFRSSIITFLTEEGYVTDYNENKVILFKKDNVQYWIDVKENSPMLIRLHRAGLGCSSADHEKVLSACNMANINTSCVKAYLSGKSVSFIAEMYCDAPDAFKNAFSSYMAQLDKSFNKVKSYYSGNYGDDPVPSAATADNVMELFFPVYEFTLGTVTTSDFKKRGYKVETVQSGSKNCDVHGLTFWDHNKDDIYEVIYTVRSDKMPEIWKNKIGLNWSLSYNQIVALFKGMDFTMKIAKEATTKNYSGRKVLNAEIVFTSPDKKYSLEFDFNYGNEKGEGYALGSQNSLYSIRIKAL